jgi:hypothetical protein
MLWPASPSTSSNDRTISQRHLPCYITARIIISCQMTVLGDGVMCDNAITWRRGHEVVQEQWCDNVMVYCDGGFSTGHRLRVVLCSGKFAPKAIMECIFFIASVV